MNRQNGHPFQLPWVLLSVLGIFLMGCGNILENNADARTEEKKSDQAIAVDVAVAESGKLERDLVYTGTTAPIREATIKSQVEGQVETLSVDIGDRVAANQVLVTIEDQILLSAVDQAKAEKLAQRSQILTAQSQVGDAQIKVEQARLQLQQAQADITRLETSLNARIEQARLQLQQAQADADRLEYLATEGAGSPQQAEQARTSARQAEQLLRSEEASAAQQLSQARTAARTAARILDSALAQVKIEQQQVAAATAQMNAQRATIDQAQTRQQFASIEAPFSGKILQRLSDPGDLVQPGSEILKLGDFSQLTINVQVSELVLAKIRPQQTVSISLDAFPDQIFKGRVARISPMADPSSRLIPVEITLPNPDRRIGAGLLARVSFPQAGQPTVVVPESAINQDSDIFVVTGTEAKPVVERRSVQTGKKVGGKVQILAGLNPSEKYVVRSSRPLKSDSQIRLSILSQTSSP